MQLAKRQARARSRAKSMNIRRGFKGRADPFSGGTALTPSKFGWMSPWSPPYGMTVADWQSAKKKARRS
jgi:hypothetical protein